MSDGMVIEYDHPFELLAGDKSDENVTKDGHFAKMVLSTGKETS